MYFLVYDAEDKLRYESDNWPMTRSALDVVISEGPRSGKYPVLLMGPEPKEGIANDDA